MNLVARRVTRAWICALSLLIAGTAVGATRYVAPGGMCGGQTPCDWSIQKAVDAAFAGDTIKVAAGTYTGSVPVMVDSITYDQVVIIDKSLTVQGGYTTSNWTTPNPTANLTTIDAGGHGRPVTIVGTGSETVTIAGFTMTGGNYDNLGNPAGVFWAECGPTGADCGGGFYARSVTLHLSDSVITGNTVSTTKLGVGGGAYLALTLTGTTIENTVFSSNNATYPGSGGGGLFLHFGSDATFSGCTFINNNSGGDGGGLKVLQPGDKVTVEDTVFTGNTSPSGHGGAIYATLLTAGTILELDRVSMTSNQSFHTGAAAFHAIHAGTNDVIVEMNNVIMADNTVSFPGTYEPVVTVEAGTAGSMTLTARQLTFAGHGGMSALLLNTYSVGSVTANLTNVLIEDADAAFVGNESGAGDVIFDHTNTMTNNVTSLHVIQNGAPTFTANNPLTGLPNLDTWWRLQANSDAIDAGVNSGVADDIDGDPRPIGGGFDIGADEYVEIFGDGFESGSTSLWSSTVP